MIVKIFIEKSSSSSFCSAISTDFSDLSHHPLPIVHRFRQVLRATPRILTEQLYVVSSWSPWFCLSIWRSPLEYIIYELVPASPAVSCMSGCLTWIVFVLGGRLPYSCCFVACCLQDLFNIGREQNWTSRINKIYILVSSI